MKTLTSYNHEFGRVDICPYCQSEQINYIGHQDAPYIKPETSIAKVYECQKCFEIFWQHAFEDINGNPIE